MAWDHGYFSAAAFPEGQFTGIDFQPDHIVYSRRLAQGLGLANVNFQEADFPSPAGGPRSFGQLLKDTGIALPELAKTVSLLLHAGRIGFDRSACADFNRARQVNGRSLQALGVLP